MGVAGTVEVAGTACGACNGEPASAAPHSGRRLCAGRMQKGQSCIGESWALRCESDRLSADRNGPDQVCRRPVQASLRLATYTCQLRVEWFILLSAHAGAMMLDATRKPELYFGLHPAHRAHSYAHPTRESALGLELVDHRAPEAGDFADLGQTKNLDRRFRC